ncbi:MAG: hypothetical protein ACOC2W_02870 [bacterium]
MTFNKKKLTKNGLILFTKKNDLLLDKYLNSSGAYSLRYLKYNYINKSVISVRRSFDGDILEFKPNDIINGNLENWVGEDNDGYVTTWYDQSGNNFNLVQPIDTYQPLIVSSGSLIYENELPTIYFTSSVKYFMSLSEYPTNVYQSSFFVVKTTGTNERILDTRGVSPAGTLKGWQVKVTNNSDISAIDNGEGLCLTPLNDVLKTQKINSCFMYGGSNSYNKWYRNSLFLDDDTNANIIDYNSGNNLFVGANILGTSNQQFTGNCQEIILYTSDKLINRIEIESNMNEYYNVY